MDDIKHIKELIKELDIWIRLLERNYSKQEEELEEYRNWERDILNDYNKGEWIEGKWYGKRYG